MPFPPSQDAAIKYPIDRSCLVIAGPGTGKTYVLTHRILYLLTHHHFPPDRLLTVTFTNRAAAEMRSRLASMIGSPLLQSLTLGTFHSVCLEILRSHLDRLNLPPHFGIADEDLQGVAAARAMPGVRVDREVLGRLSREKLGWRRPEDDDDPRWQQRVEVYTDVLRQNALLDFDDLLLTTRSLFIDHPDVLEAYQTRFAHILVDEFQDTDLVQYELLKLMAGRHTQLFVVADDEQSIFAWRGATPDNLFRFSQDFLGEASPVFLTENRRSSPEILRVARRLIEQNAPLFVKSLTPAIPSDDTMKDQVVRYVAFETAEDETAFLVDDIQRRLRETPRRSYADFAVLYARHEIGEAIETACMARRFPCQLIARRGLFDHPSVHRLLSLLRVAINPDDDLSLESFFREALTRDVAIFDGIKQTQRERGIRFRSALSLYTKRTSIPDERKILQRLIGLIGMVKTLVGTSPSLSLNDLIDDILDSLPSDGAQTLREILHDLSDPLDEPVVVRAVETLVPLCEEGGEIIIVCGDEVQRRLITEVVTAALRSVSPVTVIPAIPDTPLDLTEKTVVLSFDEGGPSRSRRIIHLGEPIHDRRYSETLLAWKLCQAITDSIVTHDPFPSYTIVDCETTGLGGDAEVVELAALRVEDGREVASFHSLIKPSRPIDPEATRVHGITDTMVQSAPTFRDVTPRFKEVIGDTLLVAHNGYSFDFPILDRMIGERLTNPRLDTLVWARAYVQGKRSLDALCERFGVPATTHHRAIDDCQALDHVFRALKGERRRRHRLLAHEPLLDHVALGILLSRVTLTPDTEREHRQILRLGAHRLLNTENDTIRSLTGAIPRLDPVVLQDRLSALLREMEGVVPQSGEEYHRPLDRLLTIIPAVVSSEMSLHEAIRALRDFSDLYRREGMDWRTGEYGGWTTRNAVHLLTLYAAKGLEFPEVYIVGLEEGVLPNFSAVRSSDPRLLEEQRRVLYVGITRAQRRLTLTSARRRKEDRPETPSRFIGEIWEDE
jgi:DNA polymerase III epsilon subunit family exonuclease